LPKAIRDDLFATLGLEAMTYRTAARDVHDAKFTHPQVTSPRDRISRQFGESGQAVLVALKEQPFPSITQLSRATHR
jgi:hypothetical protein